MATRWQKVHVFISSTFNDMHAERDYLVKRVFPQLREWCERRKIRLVDIDLRWGVTEQDATHNKNVVKVCLDRIDDCRPFFVCFLGQRRGWVPKPDEVSAETMSAFPDLGDYVGEASVTELEILHALINPLHRRATRDPSRPPHYYERAKHAFFYLRDSSYLDELPSDSQHRQVYTNEWVEDPAERDRQDLALKEWREEKIPATRRPVHAYRAEWNPDAQTPELRVPLQCTSVEPVNIERWRKQWQAAGVSVTSLNVEDDPAQAEKANRFNARLCTGRLTDFGCSGIPLSEVILADLKEAIAARFPDHDEATLETDLETEINQQEYFLFLNAEGFIERGDDFLELDEYVESDSDKLFVLTAAGGMGKSMLLANWVDRYRTQIKGLPDRSIHFRFIGASDRSTTIYSLLRYLLLEMKEAGRLESAIPDDPVRLRSSLTEMLREVAAHGKTVIMIDALNQLETGLSDLTWLPDSIPKNVKMIVSFKREGQQAEELYRQYLGSERFILSQVKPFANLDDRRKLVRAYLSQYLKELDERHLEALITSDGAGNPLYLKVVLSELRVFGAFANLQEGIRRNFGKTPVTAFEGMLRRLETDPAYTTLNPRGVVPLIFSLLAHARQGLLLDELVDLIVANCDWQSEVGGNSPVPADATVALRREQARDAVGLYLRQVRPFLAHREGRYDFFYESLRVATETCYVGEASAATPTRRAAREWHHLLVRYLEERGDRYPRTLRDYIFHLVGAGDGAGIKRCFREGFLDKKRGAGYQLDEIQTDFLRALDYFRDQGDVAGMFIAASGFRRGGSEVILTNYESFLIWLGAVLAAEDNRAEINRTVAYVDTKPAGQDRLRMVAEFLTGLGDHPAAARFRERHRRDLEGVIEKGAQDGLDLLASEALGRLGGAFEMAIEKARVHEVGEEKEGARLLCRMLKMVRRHSEHPRAPVLEETLLTALDQKSFTFLSVFRSLGLLAPSDSAQTVREQAVARYASGLDRNTLYIASYLANIPELMFPIMDAIARGERVVEFTNKIPLMELGEDDMGIESLKYAMTYLGWFIPELERHEIISRVVAARLQGRRPMPGFPPWRSKILIGHIERFVITDAAPLIPLFALWARLLHESTDARSFECASLTDIGAQSYATSEVFEGDVPNVREWIELGESLCGIPDFALARRVLDELISKAGNIGSRRSIFVFLGFTLVYLIANLHYLMAATFFSIGIIGKALWRARRWLPSFLSVCWSWALKRPGSQLLRSLEGDQKRIKQTSRWLYETGVWRISVDVLLKARRDDLALKLVVNGVPTPEAFFGSLAPRRWRQSQRAADLIRLFGDFVEARADPDEAEWRSLSEDLGALAHSNQPQSLSDAGLRLVGKGRITLGQLVGATRRMMHGHRIVLRSQADLDALTACIAQIGPSDGFVDACYDIGWLKLSAEHLHCVASSVLQLALMRHRISLAEASRAITKWQGIKDREARSEMRTEYLALLRAEYSVRSWFELPFLFGILRFLYRRSVMMHAVQGEEDSGIGGGLFALKIMGRTVEKFERLNDKTE